MSNLEAQSAVVQNAYSLLLSSARDHVSSTAENCARFIVSWSNEQTCGWGPASIVSRDASHREAIFTILHSLCRGIWYPPVEDVRMLRNKFGIKPNRTP